MVVGLIFIERPNLTTASTMNKVCKEEAEDLERTLQLFLVAHIMSFFATAFREMYSAKTDLFGQLMRIMEVLCIPVLFAAILSDIEIVTMNLVRMGSTSAQSDSDPLSADDSSDTTHLSQGQLYLSSKCARKDWI